MDGILNIAPGIFTEGTQRSSKNRWTGGVNVRFFEGLPETSGGSVPFGNEEFAGICRALRPFQALAGNIYTALATNERVYIMDSGEALVNVTPVRDSGTLGANPFTTSAGSPIVTVADASHGLSVGDWVNFTGASATDNITISGDYQVTAVVSSSVYTITHSASANSAVTGGGAAVAYIYEIAAGPADSRLGNGWGIGPWRAGLAGSLTNPFTTTNLSASVKVTHTAHGRNVGDYVNFTGASAVGGITINGWYIVTIVDDADNFHITHGSAATSTAGPGGGTVATIYCRGYTNQRGWGQAEPGSGGVIIPARVWMLESWGEDIVGAYVGGTIYYFDSSAGISTSNRMTVISNAPDTVQIILVSPEARFLIAFGAHDGASSDPLLIRWCSQEDVNDWTPTVINTAGDQRIDIGNKIVAVAYSNGEILVLTNLAAYVMSLIGYPEVFSIKNRGKECGAISPHCMAVAANTVYWKGFSSFFKYDGTVQEMPCDVNAVAFSVNETQIIKSFAGVNSAFSEIWFFSVSADSTEIDRAEVYNYAENLWWIADDVRTAWVDRSEFSARPLAAGTDGFLHEHETGADNGALPRTKRLVSYEAQPDDGENVSFIKKLYPDFARISGSVSITVTARRRPQSVERTKGPVLADGATVKREIRLRGGQVGLTLESTALGDSWRLAPIGYDGVTYGQK